MKRYEIAQDMRKQHSQFAFLRIGCGLLLTILPIILFVIGHAYATSSLNAIWLVLAISGIALLMGPALDLWKIRETRIIVTDETIAFVSPGLELQTSWNNLVRIRNLMHPVYESLLLHEPVMPKSTWWIRLLHLGQPKQEIPLSMFDWRNTGLEQDIREHAPHLFALGTTSDGASKDFPQKI
jgi:hypothetical protein